MDEELKACRYRVEKTGYGFWPYCVRAGDGTRELFKGYQKQCMVVAAELETAFEDGKAAPTQQQNNGVIVPRAIAERMAIDSAQYEHEHAVVNDNVQLWQQPRARLTLTVGDLRTVRALLGKEEN